MPSTLMDLYKTGGSSYVSGKEMSMKKFPQSQVVISVPLCSIVVELMQFFLRGEVSVSCR